MIPCFSMISCFDMIPYFYTNEYTHVDLISMNTYQRICWCLNLKFKTTPEKNKRLHLGISYFPFAAKPIWI